MNRILLRLAFLLIAIASSPHATHAASFTVLGMAPGLIIEEAASLSANGSTVVGTARTETRERRAFVWDAANGMRLIEGFPTGTLNSTALDVSGDGSKVVGGVGSSAGSEAFIWDATNGVRVIGDLPGGDVGGLAYGISDDGSTVVGRGTTGPSTAPSNWEAFVWDENNGLRGLSALPGGAAPTLGLAVSGDGSTIVGQRLNLETDPARAEAFTWDAVHGIRALESLGGDFLGGSALAVSADGTTAVGVSLKTGIFTGPIGSEQKAVIWDSTLGVRALGSIVDENFGSKAVGVSADGSVVIGTDNWPPTTGGFGRPASRAFIWDEANGMRGVDVLLASLGIDLTGWKLTEGIAISADGRTILGRGADPDGIGRIWIAVIPEPGTAVLIGLGLAALARRDPRNRERSL